MKPLYSFSIDCLPPSVNHLYRAAWRNGKPCFYKEPKVKEFEEAAGWQLKKIKKPLSGALTLEVSFGFEKKSTYNRRDLDNCLKGLLDALAENHIIENDNQIVRIVCEKELTGHDGIFGELSQ